MHRNMSKLATLSILYTHDKLDVLNIDKKRNTKEYYKILTAQENNKPILYFSPKHPEKNGLLKNDKAIFPMVKAYCIRNAVAHSQDIPLTEVELWEHFYSMFYTMIEATYKFKYIITEMYRKKEISYQSYIDKIINEYEKKLAQNFTYIPLSMELDLNEYWEDLEDKYEDLENIKFEKVNEDLNSNDIKLYDNSLFNKVKLIGYAGVGKTTILEHTVYEEAKEIEKNHYKGRIPILIQMINVSDKSDTIEKLIAEILGSNNIALISELIRNNMLKLYIDGINEIAINNQTEKLEYIKDLEFYLTSEDKKDLKVVVTDRDDNVNSIFNKYPKFILSGITAEDIDDFIEGNSKRPDRVKEKINEKMKETPRFSKVLQNPFMLQSLIKLIEFGKKIPENPEKIAGMLLQAIVEREKNIKRDYRAEQILKYLVQVVGKEAESRGGQNAPRLENITIKREDLAICFNEYCDLYKRYDRFDFDEFIDLIVKLGILRETGIVRYTFVNERYYRFFLSEAEDLLI